MKLSGARLARFLKVPDESMRAALVYGPDRGLVRERIADLTRAVVGPSDDGFRIIDISGSTVRSDPPRLADEAASMSLTGGRRVVRVADGSDGLVDAVRNVLSLPNVNALVIVEGSELPPRSRLRRVFEDEEGLVAIACYADSAETLERLITETFAAASLEATADAVAYLVGHLGADRGTTRQELEKVITFKGGEGSITLDDVRAAVGDGVAASLDAIVNGVFGGDSRGLDMAVARAFDDGIASVAMLRAVARHLQRLHRVQALVQAGKSPQYAMKSLSPPVFPSQQTAFRAHLDAWSPVLLASAVGVITEAEIACKSTGLPVDAICSRALMRLTQAARSSRPPTINSA